MYYLVVGGTFNPISLTVQFTHQCSTAAKVDIFHSVIHILQAFSDFWPYCQFSSLQSSVRTYRLDLCYYVLSTKKSM